MPPKIKKVMTVGEIATIAAQLRIALAGLDAVVAGMEEMGLPQVHCTSTTEIQRSLKGVSGFAAGAQAGFASAIGNRIQKRTQQVLIDEINEDIDRHPTERDVPDEPATD